jgi:hypothetical protein
MTIVTVILSLYLKEDEETVRRKNEGRRKYIYKNQLISNSTGMWGL